MLGRGYLLTVHESAGTRARHPPARRRRPVLTHGPDHLLWAIGDDIVDGYFPFADRLGDAIDDGPGRGHPHRHARHPRAAVRAQARAHRGPPRGQPVREVFNQLTNRDIDLIDADEVVYFRDIYDHVIRLTDELDNYRELAPPRSTST